MLHGTGNEAYHRRTDNGLAMAPISRPIGGRTFAADPGLSARDARLLWTAARNPFVLAVTASRAAGGAANSFDLARLAMPTMAEMYDRREHILIGTAEASLRLDVIEGTLLEGPVALTYHIPGLADARTKLQTAARLFDACHKGRLVPAVRLSRDALQREMAQLAVWDLLMQGASLRDIGETIFGFQAVKDGWPHRQEHMKSAVRRLVAGAKARAVGGYKEMLIRAAQRG